MIASRQETTGAPPSAEDKRLVEPAPIDEIIVVDDERAIAQCIADLLAEEGYRVQVFHNGASALLAIMEHQPQLVLVDIAMPVMGGDELLTFLRNRGYKDLPIVLMSANPHLSKYLNQGATDVIAKPFDLEELLRCINMHVHSTQHQTVSGSMR